MLITNLYKRFKQRVSIFLSYWEISKKMYDFDFSSILFAELHQMKRVRKSIEKYKSHVDWEYDVSRIKLAERILEMYFSCEWFEYDKDGNCILPYINTKNYKRFASNISMSPENDCVKRHIYEEKLWNVYCLIRKYNTRHWWD